MARSSEHQRVQREGKKRDYGTCCVCGSKERPEGHHVIEYQFAKCHMQPPMWKTVNGFNLNNYSVISCTFRLNHYSTGLKKIQEKN